MIIKILLKIKSILHWKLNVPFLKMRQHIFIYKCIQQTGKNQFWRSSLTFVLSQFFLCEKFIPQYIILQCRGIKKTAPSELIWLILISVHLFFLRPKKHDEKKQLTPFERKLLMLVISSCDMQCMPSQARRNGSKFGGDILILPDWSLEKWALSSFAF